MWIDFCLLPVIFELMHCFECKKQEGLLQVAPNRHLLSPNRAKYYCYFCSQECKKKYEREVYDFWAELDRNASDSECFEHTGWQGKMRLGICKITGKVVRTEPLMPGNNSGQPLDCYDHFVLRKRNNKI